MVKVLVKKLNSKVKLPEYKTKGSSGMDLMAFIDTPIKILPNTLEIIPTGLYIAIPEDLEIQIRPRSGLFIKNGISANFGTIDSDYRGEIGVILINLSHEKFIIKSGERIAQMVISKHEQVKWEVTESLPKSNRGEKGFGSTGK